MNVLTQLNGLLPTSGGSMADLNSYTLLQSAGFGDELMTFGVIAVIVILVGTAA